MLKNIHVCMYWHTLLFNIQEEDITAGEQLQVPYYYYSVIHLQAYYSGATVPYLVIAVKLVVELSGPADGV